MNEAKFSHGTVTERCNKDIRRLKLPLMAKCVHTNGGGCTQLGMISIPVSKGVVSESSRPPWGHKAMANATQWDEDSARLRGFLCHSHAGFNAHLASCPRSPD